MAEDNNTGRIHKLLAMSAVDPADSFLKYAIAKEWEYLGENDKALNAFQELVTNDPDYSGAYYHFGKLLERLGSVEDALTIYSKGIALCTANKDFHALSELKNAKTNLELGLDD